MGWWVSWPIMFIKVAEEQEEHGSTSHGAHTHLTVLAKRLPVVRRRLLLRSVPARVRGGVRPAAVRVHRGSAGDMLLVLLLGGGKRRERQGRRGPGQLRRDAPLVMGLRGNGRPGHVDRRRRHGPCVGLAAHGGRGGGAAAGLPGILLLRRGVLQGRGLVQRRQRGRGSKPRPLRQAVAVRIEWFLLPGP